MGQITLKDFSSIRILKLFKIFLKIRREENDIHIKEFIREYYCMEKYMPEDFYLMILNKLHSDEYFSLLNVLIKRNIYALIDYLKNDIKDKPDLPTSITPAQYYITPKKHINRIIEMLKKLECENNANNLGKSIKDNPIWLLKRNPKFDESEYREIAYKIYLSIGFNNAVELLGKRYGEITYEQVYFLFSRLNTKDELNETERQCLNSFLFDNKKDFNNPIRQMLNGNFPQLFLNFDYFYNHFNYFINQLGRKLPKIKVKDLLEERYLPRNASIPEITCDILSDMLSSYYCKYESLDTPEQEIYNKNYEIYNKFLRHKHKSSIPRLKPLEKQQFICEILKCNDPRNLVLGYRSGNCFRINGEAATLFYNFLQSEHMRLLSISTPENKDFAMMLIMRNGNVLIGQGIEVSKWAPSSIKGKQLYDTCREVLKEMMDYMNSTGDEIVATIIGSSNSNVSEYNNQVLPFLISPILESPGNYYNGIYNYQCIFDIREGKNLQDIKLYSPSTRYFDEREPILRRERCSYNECDEYMEIEKRLIALRFSRTQGSHNLQIYQDLLNHQELYTCCNRDWYITLFDDGTIDSFICDGHNADAKNEYDSEMRKIYQKYHPKK